MKHVTLANCNNKTVEWISKVEMRRINIEIKIPGAYKNDQFLMDVNAGAILENAKHSQMKSNLRSKNGLLEHFPNQDASILPTQ